MNWEQSIIDLEHLRRWVGKDRRVADTLAPFPARALAAALDRNDAFEEGEALPPAWHWLYFLETPLASATGPDGHSQLGGFLPPVPLRRRMWAGGHLEFLRPLVLGRPAMRHTVIRSVEAKSGRSGPLVFVTLDHELSQEGQPCVREQQDLVYREMPAAPVAEAAGEAAPAEAEFGRLLHPDPVLLFRYSALTYNGHRIHYDRTYAVQQEFYPALVIHGPLLATLLLDLLHDNLPQARVRSFTFRAHKPAFDTAPLELNGRCADDAVTLWTSGPGGALGMSATAKLASNPTVQGR